jgi:hypothetical protein
VTAAQCQSPPAVRGYWDEVFRSGKIQFIRNASNLLQYAISDRNPDARSISA